MRVLNERMLNWAKDKVKEGYYKNEIAEALFVSPATIQIALKGIEPPKREPLSYNGTSKAERNEFVKEKLYEGYQQKEIAEAVGVHISTVNQLTKRNGYKKKLKEKLVYDFSEE